MTARGDRREPIFEDGDRDILAERTSKAAVEVWGYCVMSNQVT